MPNYSLRPNSSGSYDVHGTNDPFGIAPPRQLASAPVVQPQQFGPPPASSAAPSDGGGAPLVHHLSSPAIAYDPRQYAVPHGHGGGGGGIVSAAAQSIQDYVLGEPPKYSSPHISAEQFGQAGERLAAARAGAVASGLGHLL